MLIVPWYSRVGECCVDIKIIKVELRTPKNSQWEERQKGCSTIPSSVLIDKEARKHENNHLLQKRNWEQNSHSYIVVYGKKINNIYTHITGLNQLVKW